MGLRRAKCDNAERDGRSLLAAAALCALLSAGLAATPGLLATSHPPARPKIRPVTVAEAQRLAAMRLADYQTGHSGVRASIGEGPATVRLIGWVDWRAQHVYLNVIGPPGDPDDGLIQAVPGFVALHHAQVEEAYAETPFSPPPAEPPTNGWQVRPAQSSSPIDTVITLLFTLRADVADDPGVIQAVGSTFVSTDQIGGMRVDVMDGAAIPPARPASGPTAGNSIAMPGTSPGESAFAANGGQVRYWIDTRSRLLRAVALIDPHTRVQIDFDPADTRNPHLIEQLGGPTTHARASAP